MQIIRPLLIFLVSQAVFSSIEYFLKMNAQKIRFLNAYSVKLLFHFFFKFGKKSHDSEFGIQRLAIVDLERVKGLKKQNGGKFVEVLELYKSISMQLTS